MKYVPVKEELLNSATRLDKLGAAMGMTRKMLRFGREIDLIRGIKQTIEDIASGQI